MVTREVKSLKFALADSEISRSKLEECQDAYDIFILLEQHDLLGPKNVSYLHGVILKLETTDRHIKFINWYNGKLYIITQFTSLFAKMFILYIRYLQTIVKLCV